jgi:hypothetical protein
VCTQFKGRKKGGGKSDLECYNCHKKGHIKAKWWAKGGGKEGQGPSGKGKPQTKKEQASMANTDSEDAAWMVTIEDDTSDSDSDDKNSPCKWIHNNARRFLVNNDEGEAYTQYQSAGMESVLISNCTTQMPHDICPPTVTISLICIDHPKSHQQTCI